jgi:hypothetical protein
VDVEGNPIGLFERENTLYAVTYSEVNGLAVQEVAE